METKHLFKKKYIYHDETYINLWYDNCVTYVTQFTYILIWREKLNPQKYNLLNEKLELLCKQYTIKNKLKCLLFNLKNQLVIA